MKVVILAGGLGTRLQPYTFFIPKPMLPLGNKPILEHIIDWIKCVDKVDHVILCTSYLHRTIENYFEDGSSFDIKIEYVKSERPLGTAGQLKTAEKLLDNTFVCLNSDHTYPFSLDNIINEHIKSKALVSMAIMQYKTDLKYGFIEVNEEDNMIISWTEKPEISGLINIGCYIIEPEFLKLIPESSTFGMDDAVRRALQQNRIVKGFKIESSFLDIGDKKSYLDARKIYIQKIEDHHGG